ncbi:peptidase inhibitor family I36 protein [Streptomyces sp. NRRL S-340]|uniref:peptidase inhibitor family I36 protein n=1 Tax=Streptomyces sp. NRRL S-340 TaxID=1463901 RepID=UPI000569F584|nr:peptidase inhibitor family I36 protein [Streptomyces sp. NRRL S-340]
MHAQRIVARLGTAAAASLALVGVLAGQSSATSDRIDGWNTNSAPVRCGTTSPYFFCLYYSPGAEGAVWKSRSNAVRNLSGATFYDDGYGSAGAGQPVRNNAASAENASSACNVGIWYSPDYQGNSNWLSPGKGGNLTSYLRNNEASIAISDHTRCPGVGH